jgi:hypothetical protein
MMEVLEAIWMGAMVGALLKLASPHPRWTSYIFAALVGGVGAVAGLFVARVLGVNREYQSRTLAVAGGIATITVVLYAAISQYAVRRYARRTGRTSRPTVAF